MFIVPSPSHTVVHSFLVKENVNFLANNMSPYGRFMIHGFGQLLNETHFNKFFFLDTFKNLLTLIFKKKLKYYTFYFLKKFVKNSFL